MKIDMPADRHLLNYMRVKIVQKTDPNEVENVTVINSTNLNNLKFKPGEYCLIVEGVFPYNTAEG